MSYSFLNMNSKIILSASYCNTNFQLFLTIDLKRNKTGVINDPFGQTHSLASLFSLEICMVLISGDGRTTCTKTMITNGRDCGLAEWINIPVL